MTHTQLLIDITHPLKLPWYKRFWYWICNKRVAWLDVFKHNDILLYASPIYYTDSQIIVHTLEPFHITDITYKIRSTIPVKVMITEFGLRVLDRIVTDNGLRLLIEWDKGEEPMYISFPPDPAIQKVVLDALARSETLNAWYENLRALGIDVSPIISTKFLLFAFIKVRCLLYLLL